MQCAMQIANVIYFILRSSTTFLPSFLPSFHYNTWCRRLFFRKSLCLGGRLQLQGEEEEEKKNAAAAKD
jgi:hypothetical protein